MTESAQRPAPAESHQKTSWHDKVTLTFAAAAILVSLTFHLGVIGLAGPDEPRYAWIARDMVATGDWVTPRLYGRPWFEKPILYYWAAAVGFRLHLPSEWAARLPSALAALAVACALAWLGWKFAGNARGAPLSQSAALWAPLIFATNVAGVGFSRAAAPDMLFSASLTLAMACAAAVLTRVGALGTHGECRENESRNARFVLMMFGVFLGLAVLAKGPAGIVLAAGAMLLWALATRQWRAALRLTHPIAVAAFCVVALPWYILCAARNHDFIRIFIFEHNFSRYLTNEFQHRQPFWFFGAIALAALLPWTALLFAVAQDAIRSWQQKTWINSPGFLFACWAAFPILFFSFSQSKLPGYILPAIPPGCLLLGFAAARRCRAGSPVRWVPIALCATWIVLLAVLLRKATTFFPGQQLRFLTTAVILVLALVVAFAAAWRFSGKRVASELTVGVVTAMFLLEVGALFILPAIEPALSARPAVALISPVPLGEIAAFRLRRSWQFQLNFYLHRELPEWMPEDSAHAWVFTTQEGAMAIMHSGREIVTEKTDAALGGELRLVQVELAKAKPDWPN